MHRTGPDRRALLGLSAGVALVQVPRRGDAAGPALRPNEPGPYDLVITGGRVVDPETGLDAVRNVGLKGDRIAAISEAPLQGATVLQAGNMIVTPGFIDLHSHSQQLPAARVQAFDGVTTALELESGLLPIGQFYDVVAREGRPINYGAAAAWSYARVAVKESLEPEATLAFFQRAFARSNWQNTLATEAEVERIIALVEQGLKEGGIGIGVNAGYAPGYGRKEYYAVAQLAARHDVPTYTHFRYLNVIEPQSSFEALGELISLAATTGAHMHVCHLNSTGGRDVVACAELIRGAQARGLKVTTEAYPYGAGSSAIGAEVFRGGNWLERWGVTSPSNMTLNGSPLTQAQIDELQRSAPGTPVVMHFLRPDDDPRDSALMDASVLFPGGAIASDATPWTDASGAFIEGDVWPLPADAFAHPRGAGCYCRFIGRWVRDRNALPLMEAIRKTSLIPAQILEHSVAQMRTKGRLQVGADADIVVFDLATIRDRATFNEPTRLSEGMRHVLVNGTAVIRDGALIRDAKPGRPIRRPISG